MKTAIKLLFFIALVVSTSACAEQVKAPTDQLIKGGYDITAEWQIISFEKPLKTIPYLQSLNFNFNQGVYEIIDTNEEGKIVDDPMKYETILRKKDKKILFLEVIAINQHGRELPLGRTSLGSYHGDGVAQYFIGFGIDRHHNKLYFSPKTKITAIKVKSNSPMNIQNIHWTSSRYYQSPGEKWDEQTQRKYQDKVLKNW